MDAFSMTGIWDRKDENPLMVTVRLPLRAIIHHTTHLPAGSVLMYQPEHRDDPALRFGVQVRERSVAAEPASLSWQRLIEAGESAPRGANPLMIGRGHAQRIFDID